MVKISFGQQDTLPEVEVEANKINTPSQTYKSIPLKLSGANNLGAVLSENTPIYIKSYGQGSLSTVSIRGGSASQTQIIWNGFSINSPTLGQSDLAIASTSLIDVAAVHLGASSIVNTSGGLGGAIQLSNQTTFDKRINLDVTKELGSFGIDNTTLKLKVGNKKWQSFTGLVKKHADNNFQYRDFLQKEPQVIRQTNANYDQLELAQNFYYHASNHHRLNLKTNLTMSQRLLPPVMGVKTRGERQKDDVLKTALEWSYNKDKYFQQVAFGYFYDFLNYIDTMSAIDSKVQINAYKAYYKGKYYVNDSIQLRASLNTERVIANSSGFDGEKEQLRNALFLEYYQNLKYNLSYTFSLRKELISSVVSPIVPALSLKWYIKKQHQVLFSAAQNFRAPTLNDLFWSPGGNPDLQPEEGKMTDLGYTYKTKEFSLGLTGYYSLIQNWIQWLPSHEGYWKPQNIKEVESYGVELNGVKKIKLKGVTLDIHGGYNLVFSKNKKTNIENDLSIGKQLIYVPQNSANISMNLAYKTFYLTYQQSYTGVAFIDAGNQVYMPYFAPATLGLGWKAAGKKAKNRLEIITSVVNLFDEEYQIIANRPMPGRYYTLTIKVNFKK
ncbi:MAG: TonB-dependent receptor [Flavobacteriales bacterium]|nr:TonB-dependent receptor [Flavobacteriales bacterium]